MLKIAWLSDTHFLSSGTLFGYDPRARLEAAVDHLRRHHGDADFCILSGDLVERGCLEEYQALKIHLDRLPCRYLPMVGNHDAREPLRRVFDLPGEGMEDFVQYGLDCDAGLIFCLDTQKEGASAGEFCETRAAWLSARLSEQPGRPAFLFLHHPPMALGLPMQDAERMEGGEAFLDLLRRHSNVKQLFIGHVHRPICGTAAGIPFATLRSSLYQAPAPKPDWNWESFAPAQEAPNLGIVTIDNKADVTIHYTQFCDHDTGLGAL